jgi:hypothetical protein
MSTIFGETAMFIPLVSGTMVGAAIAARHRESPGGMSEHTWLFVHAGSSM